MQHGDCFGQRGYVHTVNAQGLCNKCAVQHIVLPCSMAAPIQVNSPAEPAAYIGQLGLQQQLAAIKGCAMLDLCSNPLDVSPMQTLHVSVAALGGAQGLHPSTAT